MIAATDAHARALADNLVNQGYRMVAVHPTTWVLRRSRLRRTEVVTIDLQTPPAFPPWGPPAGPAAG